MERAVKQLHGSKVGDGDVVEDWELVWTGEYFQPGCIFVAQILSKRPIRLTKQARQCLHPCVDESMYA